MGKNVHLVLIPQLFQLDEIQHTLLCLNKILHFLQERWMRKFFINKLRRRGTRALYKNLSQQKALAQDDYGTRSTQWHQSHSYRLQSPAFKQRSDFTLVRMLLANCMWQQCCISEVHVSQVTEPLPVQRSSQIVIIISKEMVLLFSCRFLSERRLISDEWSVTFGNDIQKH